MYGVDYELGGVWGTKGWAGMMRADTSFVCVVGGGDDGVGLVQVVGTASPALIGGEKVATNRCHQ